MKRLQIWILTFREWMLLGQIEHAEAIAAEYADNLRRCYAQLRSVRNKIATRETPAKLLSQALRSNATR